MICLAAVTRENFPRFQSDLLSIEKRSFTSPWDMNSFSREVELEISHFWVLTIDDVLAGYICFWIFANEIHLLNVAVHETCKRKGVGQRLLSKMVEVGNAEGAETAWLEVRPSNQAARSLYRKVGFREVGRRPRYYSDTGEDAIIMCMPLHHDQIIEGQRVENRSTGSRF